MVAHEDLIRAIDQLVISNDCDIERLSNPLSKIITYEWYYSKCYKIYDKEKIEWNNISTDDFTKNKCIPYMDTINPKTLELTTDVFEKNFTSWYKPYHYLPRTKWGIHIRYDSWMRIALRLKMNIKELISKESCIATAFLYLYCHELFHYKCENAASSMELNLNECDIYFKYIRDIYTKTFNSSNCLEESLANRYLIANAKFCKMNKQYLKGDLLRQGKGYNEFVNLTTDHFSSLIKLLLYQIQIGKLTGELDNNSNLNLSLLDPFDDPSDLKVPIWLHERALPINRN